MKIKKLKLFSAIAINTGSQNREEVARSTKLIVRHYTLKAAINLTNLEFATTTEIKIGIDTVYDPSALSDTVKWSEIKIAPLYAQHWEGKEPAILSENCVEGFCEECNEEWE